MWREYGVYEFWTKQRLSKNREKCDGMAAVDSGEIAAAVTDLGTSYREEFKTNISVKICGFPLTVEAKFFCRAKYSQGCEENHLISQGGPPKPGGPLFFQSDAFLTYSRWIYSEEERSD